MNPELDINLIQLGILCIVFYFTGLGVGYVVGRDKYKNKKTLQHNKPIK